ncbi:MULTISPECIES: TetR/AcrR family transcriptional regulator [Streptomyces]|uniref:TetR/AcrR family transcriptional regulator n=1 Tax=Streptomyces TaxID=1883 RepID=UPI0004C847C5|nr:MULTISPECIES: TetR/AcrR family transcriptional regulator [Streptomyces]MBZ6107741.1 TetR/AcrR family transcriptional regulator [Streptomyces olivaceus]RPK49009.1 Transcriptional regulator, TetR family [Streptomyces sp. ADI93-02]
MRSDAARNRQRIFDEARGAVIGGEIALTLNELARRAGVGVGTVYRVFPTQRAMLESVLEEAVRELVDAAAAAGGHPDPAKALVDFLRTALLTALAQPGLTDVLITGSDETDSLHRAKGELVEVTSHLLARIRPAPALTGENLLKLLCGLIHAVSEHPAERQGDAIDNYLDILRAGIAPTL